MTAFEVIPPVAAARPLIAHIPHASTSIPDAIRSELLLTDDELVVELARLTDRYTDKLFDGLTDLGAIAFVNRLSRLVFDPERFLDDRAEPAAAVGQGVVYTHGSQGQPLREPDEALRARRVKELYRPYHAALDELVGEVLASFGQCTLIDCHSFPTAPLPTESDRASDRPDICIGTDASHTPVDLAERLEAAFAARGYRVRRDSPYAGTFVPSGRYGRDMRVRSVMIEVRRGTYMDESSGDRLAGFAQVRSAITESVLAAIGS